MLDCLMMLALTKCHWTFTRSWRLWFDSGMLARSIFGAQEDCGMGKTIVAVKPFLSLASVMAV